MLADKILSLQDAVSLIKDGDQVALGGHSHRRHPMALVYEIVRQKKRGLYLIGWNNGIDVDLLVGAGCAKKVQTSYVGLGKFGLALNFRRAAERGEIEIVEESETTALYRFRAGAMGISFIPSKMPLASDLMRFEDNTKESSCPFTGERVALLRRACPDVALLHAHSADRKGNIQLDERYLMENIADILIAKSARLVVVSVEEIVDTYVLMKRPHRTVLPGFFVHAVVYAPFGAHPCACDYRYDYDLDFTTKYYEASRSEESFQNFLDYYVYQSSDHWSYLEKVGLRSLLGLQARM